MKVAVTIFRNSIAPRVDISEGLLIYEIDDGVIKNKEEYNSAFEQPFQLLSVLREKGIKKILCGGCPQFLLRMLFFNGFEVMPGLAGDPGEIIEALVKGKLEGFPPCVPFGRRCRNRNRGNMRKNRH
jgi:predicted Fe-Mo cluster-binding NifX family protein